MRALLLATSLLSLSAGASEPTEVLVFAAASTAAAMTEVGTAFEAEHPGLTVRLSFAGTNELVRQLRAGAKADVLLAADEESVQALPKSRVIHAAPLLSNTLVIVVPNESKRASLSPGELGSLRRVAVADPRSVPAGRYAKRWLEQRRLWNDVEPKLIPSLDVRAALAAAEAGRVDAAIIYATDAAASNRVREVYRVPKDELKILYPAALLSADPEAARFYRFLSGARAASIFSRHGFALAEATK